MQDVTLRSYTRDYNSGMRTVGEAGPRLRLAPMTAAIQAWNTNFIKFNSEFMPHVCKVHINVASKCEIWRRYQRHMVWRSDDDAMPTERHFMSVLKGLMGTAVVIPKVKRFTKCTACTSFDDRIHKSNNPQEVKEIRTQKELHIVMQEDERIKYYHHRSKSRTNPKDSICMIMDGMDQNKTAILNLKRNTSATANFTPVKMAVISILCHSHSPYCQTFTFPAQSFPKDSSLTCELLSRAIKMIKKTMGYLPPTLYLQLDNTGRENKNTTVLNFLASLIARGVFKKVPLQCVLVCGRAVK